MTPFFALFVPVTVLTLFGQLGNNMLLRQRDELLPIFNFALFAYLLFAIAGISIFFSVRSRVPDLLASLFVVPFAGALTGWCFGLTLDVLLHAQWRTALAGFALTCLFAALCLAPVVISRLAVALAKDVLGRLFPNRTHLLLVYGMAVFLFVAGVIGIIELYGDNPNISNKAACAQNV